MKTITTDEINSRQLQNLSFYTYLATALAVLITVCSLFWMLFPGEDATTNTFVFDGMSMLTVLLGSSWALLTAHRARHGTVQLETRYQLAWTLIGLGLLANIFGRSCTGFLFSESTSPFYTVGWNFVSDLFYPLVFLGLLIMPGTTHLRTSMIFDALITVLCLLGIGWFCISGFPNLSHLNHTTLDARLLDYGLRLLYPAGDIFLVLILALLVQRGVEPALRFSFLLIAAGLLALIWADSASLYMRIFDGGYQSGTPYIDPFCLVSTLSIGLGALYQYGALVRRTYNEQLLSSFHRSSGSTPADGLPFRTNQAFWQRWWHVQGIYIPLALLLCILIFIHAFSDSEAPAGFLILGATAGACIIVRHLFASQENRTYLQEREQRYSDAERVRYLAVQLSDIRDLEQLRNRIVNSMLSEFGFTFAILVLVEEYHSPLTSHSHLQVNAASISSQPAKWRLHGDNILYHTVFSGKRTLLNWPDYQNEIPPEVRFWLDKQHVPSMLFFPLIYQDNILGSLGVARHALAHRNQSEVSIVRVYAEEIAAVIEHAYLYREARDRESFARAMANISTRLNAAVVEPAEISQLICEEGANALHADYVVLYIAHDDGQLVPLAVSMSGHGPASAPRDWPTISQAEFEMESFHTLHPFLLDITQRQKPPPGALLAALSTPTLPHEPTNRRSFTLRSTLARHYVQTSILAPLVGGGHMIGLLIFARITPPGTGTDLCFDPSDLPHAQDFVEQAGVAFANARLYQHLRATHERLQELDQLKDQFMVTASHELRTPLTAVQGYIELIVQYDDILPPEQRQEFLQKAQLGCEELAVLLRNVMDASRLEAEAGIRSALISRVSVASIIDKVQIMIEPQVTHQKRELHITIPPQLCVLADPLRLHQVLMNVSTNALKYSPEGTPISFSAHTVAEQQKHYVVISISDKGKGITPQDQARLFQRFYRLESDLNSPIRGSGLGLYISRRLIEAMGGKIWIESTGVPGEGSTFHIQLPMA